MFWAGICLHRSDGRTAFASRLARNCSDWYPLLDICGLRGCLIADRDGVYDPASANGRLEDTHLFYLMARGIPYDEARRLVIRGFFGELLAKIEVGEVRDRVAQVVEAELA